MRLALLWLGCLSPGLQPGPLVMVDVPGGTFTMGSTVSCSDSLGALCGGDHVPHQVTVSEFRIANREVTRGQWALCEQSGMCVTFSDLNYHTDRVDRPDDPVLLNDTAQASSFCAWMGGRLPTEAEFELVQRGGDANDLHTFPWGEGAPSTSSDVTPSGIHNLAGGVAEWILDGYNPAIGCPDRLTTDDVCTMSATCCGGDGGNCQAQCLPPAAGSNSAEAGTLACSPGTVAPDVDPLFTGNTPLVRGRSPGERDCFLSGYTRRYASSGGNFTAGFRCVTSSARTSTPSTLRFRLANCPAGATVNLQASGVFHVDAFDGTTATTYSSSEGVASGLPCASTFAIDVLGAVTITGSSSSKCTLTWQTSDSPGSGDSGIITLTPTTSGQCGAETCVGANLMTDANNCGACGNVCASGPCTNGSCSCSGTNVMTDSTNCGTCGHSCFGTACIGGQCQPGLIADTQPSPYAIVADATGGALFFSNRISPGGSVVGCPVNLTTGAFTCAPIASNLQNPGLLALDSGNVYWGNFDNMELDSCARGGCGSFPSVIAYGNGPMGVALEGGDLLYALNSDGIVKDCLLPNCAGGPTIIGSQSNGGFGPWGVAADANNIYYTINGAGGSLRSCPRGGCGMGSPQILDSNLADPEQIVLDSGYVYFYEAQGLSVRRWNILGATVEPLFSAAAPGFGGIATDSTHVYWTHPSDGTIWSCLKSSCLISARMIAQGQSTPLGIAVAGPGVFWANSTSGQVVGMAIPPDPP